MLRYRNLWILGCVTLVCVCLAQDRVVAQTEEPLEKVLPGRFRSLTEPPCSYCSTQHRKGLILDEDPVLCWLRGAHNGGAFPLRHFLSSQRVLNDTYGLFFYDPDGGYVSAFRKDYGYELHGWRKGVMVVRGKDGTLWSALTGKAFAGPKKGQRLQRIPSLTTTWSHWLMLHPESTAYDLFDGKTYEVTSLPTNMSSEAKRTMGAVDKRMATDARVLGVEFGEETKATKAYPLDKLAERACLIDEVGEEKIAVFWYGPTKTAVAFDREVGEQTLTFYADEISPESAPFKDKETGSRWTLAGRAVDGPLRGTELRWVNSVQCRWYAWSAEYPVTLVYGAQKNASENQQKISFRGALLAPEDATAVTLRSLKLSGVETIALQLDGRRESVRRQREACERVKQAQLGLYYWIEIARCPELAEMHPEWMASLQGHTEWRRLFKNSPRPKSDEVIKTYPWVPILNREGFTAQLGRVERLLEAMPPPEGLFLNDLQGAPSACGCGNDFCRWTTDYGKIRTTTPLGDDAPAQFVSEVRKLVPEAQVIPVWTTECEEHDGAQDGWCAGVGCFQGICWKAFTRQLMPVMEQTSTLGVLLPYRAFQRDLPVYGEPAGWISHAVKLLQDMPPRHQGQAVPAEQLIAVLQGWNIQPAEIQQQIKLAQRVGVGGYLLAYSKIEQGWEPRLLKRK